MGPWQSFVLEMTRTIVSWPTISLIIFWVLMRKAEHVTGLVERVSDRVRKFSISTSGLEIETVPQGQEFVEERPYPRKPTR